MLEVRPESWSSPTRMHAGMATLNHHHAYVYGFQNTGAKIQEDEEAAEDEALQVLLAAFPFISHEEIASAYTRAGRDVNAAGEILSTEQPNIMKSPRGRNIQTRYVMHSGDRPAVGSDELLLEKYGRGVNELICREPRTRNSKDNSWTNRNTLRPASYSPLKHLYSPHMHKQNLSGACRNSTIGSGVAMSPLVTKKKRRDGVGKAGEADSPFQTVEDVLEDFLLFLHGEDFQLHKDVISDVLVLKFFCSVRVTVNHLAEVGSYELAFVGIKMVLTAVDTTYDGPRASLKWLLQMASPHSGLDLETSLDTHKSIRTYFKLYFDKKLGVKGNPLHPLGANRHKDSLPARNKYQGHNGDGEEDPNFLLKYGGVSKNRTWQGDLFKQMADQYDVQEKIDCLKALFPAATNDYLFEKLQQANFNLRDTEKSISVAVKTDLTNYSHTKKSITQKGNGAAWTTSQPLRAEWADIRPTITPLEQTNGVISGKESPSECGFVETKKSMFKSYGDFDDYGWYRQSANEHWIIMKYYFEEAAAAYGRGEKCRAAELSEKGKGYKQLAQEANERASNRIFNSRNKDIENNITIDLHAQHVNEALEHLRRHLHSYSSIPLVTMLTIITGRGSHSIDGRARVKPAVIRFLFNCGIPWQELNDGCLTVKIKDICNKQWDMSTLV